MIFSFNSIKGKWTGKWEMLYIFIGTDLWLIYIFQGLKYWFNGGVPTLAIGHYRAEKYD